jgi:hypothetical protein
LGPPTLSFPILPAAVSAGNALAPHALRQASRRDGDWFLFEAVAAVDVVVVVARDAAETKEARRVVALAAGETVDCVLE